MRDNDKVHHLKIIDNFLLKKQSFIGNIWRNFIKFFLIPFQIKILKNIIVKNKISIVHAHGMYYMLLAHFSNINFVGTPQGSEILIRLKKSSIYRFFAIKALNSANIVTIDSSAMKRVISQNCLAKTKILQNGIDLELIRNSCNYGLKRNKVVSLRALTPLYQIHFLL